jgi:uncharacterized protein with HEPN domain
MKDDRYYIEHIHENALKIEQAIQSFTKTDLVSDELRYTAILHWLQTMGEAARNVSDTFQFNHSNIPWRAMIGMRNRIVHDYLGIDEDIVWQTISADLSYLIRELEKILKNVE